MAKKYYYDPEYDRVVDESVVQKQYEWFTQQSWFHKTFEQFAEDNFTELKTAVKQYDVPVPDGADVYEAVLDWLKKNRIRREKIDICQGTLQEDWFYHGKYRYQVTVDSIKRDAGTAKISLIAVA